MGGAQSARNDAEPGALLQGGTQGGKGLVKTRVLCEREAGGNKTHGEARHSPEEKADTSAHSLQSALQRK